MAVTVKALYGNYEQDDTHERGESISVEEGHLKVYGPRTAQALGPKIAIYPPERWIKAQVD